MKSRTSTVLHQFPGLNSRQLPSSFALFESPSVPSMAPLPRLHHLSCSVVRWCVAVCAPPCLWLGRDRRKPAFVELARELSVDMRPDQGAECMRELKIFALAAHRAVLGQESFFDDIGKQFRV